MDDKHKYGHVTTLRIPEVLWQLLKKESDYKFTSINSIVLTAIAKYYESQGKLKRDKP